MPDLLESGVTDRERFCSILSNGPLLKSDAAIVLCGEDAEDRLKIAVQMVKSGGAPFIVLSGGKHEPPRWVGAQELGPKAYGMGVSPDRILIEDESQDTHQQAVNVLDMAIKESWHRILLIASPYHQYRAFLTFLKELQHRQATDAIQLVNVPASHLPWCQSPKGMTETRLALLDTELAKIDTYGAQGHVASYADGLTYLAYWEGR